MKFLATILLAIYPLSLIASVPNDRHIVVEGQSKITAAPDMVIVTFETESQNVTSLHAKQVVDKRINNLLAGLERFSIDDKNVTASSITTYANYIYTDDDKKVLDGYIASRTVKVTLKETSMLNDLMNFALEIGVSEVKNIEFQSSRQEALRQEAVAKAVEDAKHQGRTMASAFGAKLGKVYSINSATQNHYDRYGFNDAIETIQVTGSRIEADEFEPGRYLQENIVFSATVHVVFDLEVD